MTLLKISMGVRARRAAKMSCLVGEDGSRKARSAPACLVGEEGPREARSAPALAHGLVDEVRAQGGLRPVGCGGGIEREWEGGGRIA
jgi:hypothetical protein